MKSQHLHLLFALLAVLVALLLILVASNTKNIHQPADQPAVEQQINLQFDDDGYVGGLEVDLVHTANVEIVEDIVNEDFDLSDDGETLWTFGGEVCVADPQQSYSHRRMKISLTKDDDLDETITEADNGSGVDDNGSGVDVDGVAFVKGQAFLQSIRRQLGKTSKPKAKASTKQGKTVQMKCRRTTGADDAKGRSNDGSLAGMIALFGNPSTGALGSIRDPERPADWKPGRYENRVAYQGYVWRFQQDSKKPAGGYWRKQVNQASLDAHNAKRHALPAEVRAALNRENRFLYPACKRGLPIDTVKLLAEKHMILIQEAGCKSGCTTGDYPSGDYLASAAEAVATVQPDGPRDMQSLVDVKDDATLYHAFGFAKAFCAPEIEMWCFFDVENNRLPERGRVHDHGAVCGHVSEKEPWKLFASKVMHGYLDPKVEAADRAELQKECSKSNVACFHWGGSEHKIFHSLGIQSIDALQALRWWLGANGAGSFPPDVPNFSMGVETQDLLLNIRPRELHCGLEDSFDEFYIAIGYAVALKTDMCAAYEEWGEA